MNSNRKQLFAARMILVAVIAGLSPMAGHAATGPCDIYKSGGTPCVAAHSTVRALYGVYSGNLYQVRRASDNTTKDIPVLAAGGAADASVQDKFCTGTTCTISKLYDQSEKVNHLTKAPTGGATSTQTEPDKEVDAAKWNIKVNGQSVYAAYFDQGRGYRNNSTSGIAIGDQPEGMYMVTSGTHYNGMCCFDYGNAETTNNDDGAGTMESIYFGNNTWWGKGSGDGPWVMADMENALLGGFDFNGNPTNISQTSEYVTAMLKGKANWWAIKGGNSQSGAMTTLYDGIRPTQKDWTGAGYDPMRKQGAIILGIGGDNSNSAVGTFFEGALTFGYPSEATDAAVQANIVAAGYGSKWNPDSVVSLYQNYNYDGLEAQLPVGTYTRAQLIAQGLTDNDASSMKVGKGLIVELFDDDNFKTLLGTYTSDQENFGNLGINDKVTSLRISRATTGIRNRGIATTGGLRWSQGVLLLSETEYFGSAQYKSGRLQIIDSRGRSRSIDVVRGRASTGPLPNGLYLARLLYGKANASQSFVVLP